MTSSPITAKSALEVPIESDFQENPIIGASLFLAVVALAASYLPARRAAHIDPNQEDLTVEGAKATAPKRLMRRPRY